MTKKIRRMIAFLLILIIICSSKLDNILPSVFANNDRTSAGSNLEGKLALGEKVKLSELDRGDLEYLPGVSTVLAERIDVARSELLDTELEDTERVQGVKGIGKVKGAKILEVLKLE